MTDAFDLDAFAPAPVKVTLNGKTYSFAADPDVDLVSHMLRVETAIKDVKSADDTVAAVTEGRDMLRGMLQESDRASFKPGSAQVLIIFALLVHGSSVASAVALAITPSSDDTATPSGDPDGDPVDRDEPADRGEGDAAPLGSARRSSGRSSGSAALEAGHPGTGRV